MHEVSRKPVLMAVLDKDSKDGNDCRSWNKVGNGTPDKTSRFNHHSKDTILLIPR